MAKRQKMTLKVKQALCEAGKMLKKQVIEEQERKNTLDRAGTVLDVRIADSSEVYDKQGEGQKEKNV